MTTGDLDKAVRQSRRDVGSYFALCLGYGDAFESDNGSNICESVNGGERKKAAPMASKRPKKATATVRKKGNNQLWLQSSPVGMFGIVLFFF